MALNNENEGNDNSLDTNNRETLKSRVIKKLKNRLKDSEIPNFIFKLSSTYFQRENKPKPKIKRTKTNKIHLERAKSSSEKHRRNHSHENPSELISVSTDKVDFKLLSSQPGVTHQTKIFTTNEQFQSSVTELEDERGVIITKTNKAIPDQIEELPHESEDLNSKNELPYKGIARHQTFGGMSLRSEKFETPKDSKIVITEVITERISENNSQRSVSTCLICYEKTPDCVIMECGHGGVCYDCGLEIWKSTGLCFLCRESISQLFQIDVMNPSSKGIRVLAATKMISFD